MEGEQKLTTRPKRSALDYYHAGDELEQDFEERSTSRYLGAGAAALGLKGEVSIDVMGQLAKGFDPTKVPSSPPLLARSRCGHRSSTRTASPCWPRMGRRVAHGSKAIAWERTARLSIADKSASIVFALAPPEEQIRILDAHRRAVSQVVDVMQQYLETGRGRGGMHKIGVKGLVATGHTHMTSRNLDPSAA